MIKKRLRRKVYFVDDSEYEDLYLGNELQRICIKKRYKKVSIKKYEK